MERGKAAKAAQLWRADSSATDTSVGRKPAASFLYLLLNVWRMSTLVILLLVLEIFQFVSVCGLDSKNSVTRAYESWLLTRGITNGGVENALFTYTGVPNGGQVKGLGLAKGAGSALLTVPRSAALSTTERDSRESPLPGVTDEMWRSEKILTRLSLLLLAEWQKGSASQFGDYIAMLVDLEPPFTPLHWDAESLAALKSLYPSMAAAVETQDKDNKRLYELLPFAKQGVAQERFLWAMETVKSRTFQGFGAVKGGSDGEERWLWTSVLLPAIDMVNHHSQRFNCDVAYNPTLSAFVLSPRKDGATAMAQGSEVLISYGDRDNDDLLQHFGFVEPDNPFDCFKVHSDGATTLTVNKRERETWSVPESMDDKEIKRVLAAQLALLSSAAPTTNPLLNVFLEEKRAVLLHALGLLNRA